MKILVLHGYGGNATWQKWKDRNLQHLIAPLGATLHHVDGPILLEGSSDDDYGQRRCWWRARRADHAEHYSYGGWAETIAYLSEIFEMEGPFDGVLGCSQGACCAAAVAALVHAGAFPSSLRFAIIACGFTPRDPDILGYFPNSLNFVDEEDLIAIPTLHVIGESDRTTPPDVNVALAAKFRNPVFVRHPGGHYMSLDTQSSRKYLAFLRDFASAESSAALDTIGIAEKELCRYCAHWHVTESGRPTDQGDWYCNSCWVDWNSGDFREKRRYDACDPDNGPQVIRRRGLQVNRETEDIELQRAIEESCFRYAHVHSTSNGSGHAENNSQQQGDHSH